MLAQDVSEITILTVQPLAILFRIPAEQAEIAQFTPNSQQVVFVSSATRVDSQRIALAKSESPDLILMDMSLPVMDGWEATRQIKAAVETKSIPVIALTAHAMAGDEEKALAAGCNDYETKPVDLPKLLAKIEALLHSKGAS